MPNLKSLKSTEIESIKSGEVLGDVDFSKYDGLEIDGCALEIVGDCMFWESGLDQGSGADIVTVYGHRTDDGRKDALIDWVLPVTEAEVNRKVFELLERYPNLSDYGVTDLFFIA